MRDRIVRYLTFSSAGLMAEVVGTSPTVAELESLRQWLRRCVLNLTADDGGCSLVALLSGAWSKSEEKCVPRRRRGITRGDKTLSSGLWQTPLSPRPRCAAPQSVELSASSAFACR